MLYPQVFLLDAPWRKDDKAPYIHSLHTYEQQLLAESEPLLVGYPAWLLAYLLTAEPDHEGALVVPSADKYEQLLSDQTHGQFVHSATDDRAYELMLRNLPLLEEILDPDCWNALNYGCMQYRSVMNELFYTNANILSAEGEFSYDKALFDTGDCEREYPDCRLHTPDDKPFTITVRKFPQISLQGDAGYDARGICVALINLARNFRIYEHASSAVELGWCEMLRLRMDELDFHFDVEVSTLLAAYLARMEDSYRHEKEKNPQTAGVSAHQIYLELWRDETVWGEQFFLSPYKKWFSHDQWQCLKGYYQSYIALLVDKIGYTPKSVDELTEQLVVKQELCKYIEPQQVVLSNVYEDAWQYENELRIAAEGGTEALAKALRIGEQLHFLNFHGETMKEVYAEIIAHFAVKNAKSYNAFMAKRKAVLDEDDEKNKLKKEIEDSL